MRWSISAELALNAAPHSGQRNALTFSWTEIRWIRRAAFLANCFPHESQGYGFSPVCFLK